MRIPRLTPVCVALAGMLAVDLQAQRVAVLPAADSAPTREIKRDGSIVEPAPVISSPILDDEPDFAPRREILDSDGRVVDLETVEDPYFLAMAGGSYRPDCRVDPRLLRRLQVDPGGETFAYVMIRGRMTAEHKVRRLRDIGVRIIDTHTWQSFSVRMPLAAVPALERVEFVHWIGYAQPGQKLAPDLAAELRITQPGQPVPVLVSTFVSDLGPATEYLNVSDAGGTEQMPFAAYRETVPNGPFQRALEAAGLELGHYSDAPRVYYFAGRATPAAIGRIAELDFVAALEHDRPAVPAQDQAASMISMDRVRVDYPGGKITVGVIDTGVQGPPTLHADLSNKNFTGISTVNATPYWDGHGHGTHVTGTVAGTGANDVRYMGMGPELGRWTDSRLFIGRYFDSNGKPQGDVTAIYKFMAQTQTGSPKPRLINNSWGDAPSNQYIGTDAKARTVDSFVNVQGQTYVCAAGNYGNGVWTPGVAKNAMTVGSVCDYATPTGRIARLATYHASGTLDGRLKPEVLAPGEFVTSLSNVSATGYKTKQGTSMATPQVTGALATLIEHYSSLDYQPAMLKAHACATSEYQGRPDYISVATGFGMINGYKMHYETSRFGWSIGRTATLAKSGDHTYWDVGRIPSDATHVRVVMTWIEPPASITATQARVNDVRMLLDIEPFSSAASAYDFRAVSSKRINLYYNSSASSATGFAASARGKLLRVKAYAASMGLASTAKVAVSVIWYRKDATASAATPTLTHTLEPRAVTPGGRVAMTARVQASSSSDEYENVRVWPSVIPSGATITGFERQGLGPGTAGQRLHLYTTGHPSAPYPSIAEGLVIGQGLDRTMTWNLTAPASTGRHVLQLSMTADPWNTTFTRGASLCVDNTPPNRISGLHSTTHVRNTWSKDRTATFVWSQAADNGCAGIRGLMSSLSAGSPARPRMLNNSATVTTLSYTLSETSPGNGYYFNLMAMDEVGLTPSLHDSVGPYLVDLTPPAVTKVVINNGASTTTSLNVTVSVASSDGHSGVSEFRLSSDGSTWSPWYSNSLSTNYPYNLATYGGSKNFGLKRVHAQVRDGALHVSSTKSATISFGHAPTISSVSPSQLPNVTKSSFLLTGASLDNATSVLFGTKTISSSSPTTWHDGYYTRPGADQIRVYPPQGLPASTYDIKVRNPFGLSAPVKVQLANPSTRELATHSSIPAGADQYVFMHKGGAPASGYASYLFFSPQLAPSYLKGIASLGIGGGFLTLYSFPSPLPHDSKSGIAQVGPFQVPSSARGGTLYFQALVVNLNNPLSLPIPATSYGSTRYY